MNILIAFILLIGNLFAEVSTQKLKEDVKKLEIEFEAAGKKLEDAVEKLNKASGTPEINNDISEEAVTDPEDASSEYPEPNNDSSNLESKIDEIKKELDEVRDQIRELKKPSQFSNNEQYHQALALYNDANSKEKPTKEDFEKAKESFLLAFKETEGDSKINCALHLGKICKKLSDKEKSLEYFNSVLKYEDCPESIKIEANLCIAEILFEYKDPLLKEKIETTKKMQLTDEQKVRFSKIAK